MEAASNRLRLINVTTSREDLADEDNPKFRTDDAEDFAKALPEVLTGLFKVEVGEDQWDVPLTSIIYDVGAFLLSQMCIMLDLTCALDFPSLRTRYGYESARIAEEANGPPHHLLSKQCSVHLPVSRSTGSHHRSTGTL